MQNFLFLFIFVISSCGLILDKETGSIQIETEASYNLGSFDISGNIKLIETVIDSATISWTFEFIDGDGNITNCQLDNISPDDLISNYTNPSPNCGSFPISGIGSELRISILQNIPNPVVLNYCVIGSNEELGSVTVCKTREATASDEISQNNLFQFGASSTFNGGDPNSQERCTAIVTDIYGDIYCAGTAYGGFGEAKSFGGRDIFVAKTNKDGQIIWVTQFSDITTAEGGDNTGDEAVYDLALDNMGGVYVVGSTDGSFSGINGTTAHDDGLIVKLNSDGVFQWSKQTGVNIFTGGDSTFRDEFLGVNFGEDGYLHVVGATLNNLGENVNGVAGDGIYIKIDQFGTVINEIQFGQTTAPLANGEDELFCVRGMNNGEVIMGGTTSSTNMNNFAGARDMYTTRIDNFGTILSMNAYGKSGAELPQGCSIERVTGDVYFVGRVNAGYNFADIPGGGTDAILVKTDMDATMIWEKQFGQTNHLPGFDNSQNDYLLSVNVGGFGFVYIGGYTRGNVGDINAGGNDLVVKKIDSSNGDIEWIFQAGQNSFPEFPSADKTGNEDCFDLFADNNGSVYCAGITRGTFSEPQGGINDAIILKLD